MGPRFPALKSRQMVAAFSKRGYACEGITSVLDMLSLSCLWTMKTLDDRQWFAAEYTGLEVSKGSRLEIEIWVNKV